MTEKHYLCGAISKKMTQNAANYFDFYYYFYFSR